MSFQETSHTNFPLVMLLDERTSAQVWNVFPTFAFNISIDIRKFHSSCGMVFWTNIVYAYVLSSVNLSWKCITFLTPSNFPLLKSWRAPWKRLGHDKICFRTKWLIKTWSFGRNKEHSPPSNTATIFIRWPCWFEGIHWGYACWPLIFLHNWWRWGESLDHQMKLQLCPSAIFRLAGLITYNIL